MAARSIFVPANDLIAITLIWGTFESKTVQVHILDPVSSLQDHVDVHFEHFVYNDFVLSPAFSFAFSNIPDGAAIKGIRSCDIERPKPRKERKDLWRVDESQPLQLSTSPEVPQSIREVIYQCLCHKYMPNRARLIARITDNRFIINESKYRFRPKLPQEEATVSRIKFSSPEDLTVFKSDKPSETALPPLVENKDTEAKAFPMVYSFSITRD